ncbi:alpha-N-acetylglucosaminidase [Anopheles ziemanni]|uniref:alpha-N-acetylglucosaminidase n=1 Tax=Anopheles coustani TaxID=139045 RepID=UPI0026589451|nr:alpha-N-acetylglucosaminidase [Anopheles coustani]XP_058170798.1 alpha-N-acetylglucosaminidase [Anopheles ziemanni]
MASLAIWLLLGTFVFEGYAHRLQQHNAHILQHVRPRSSEEMQRQAALEVIGRLIPEEQAKQFHVTVESSMERNSFQIFKGNAVDQPVEIRASSGVAATKAFYHYLRNFCGCLVAWEGSQLQLPNPLPAINVSIIAPSSIVYYQNVCTWSYSFTWWRWSQWRRHIDWMALQGITLSLAPFQEDIWTEVFLKYNLTKPQIDNHLSGPGFFAWQRMGNIRGWGGPLTKSFADFGRTLQQRVVYEMRRLGMALALPAFAGHLPVQFRALYPNVTFANVSVWNNFPPQYASPLFLEPTEPLFVEIGTRFLQRMVDVYGSDHIYFSDPFNEIDPASPSGKYLSSVASAIFSTMTKVDPAAVWLLQGWMFVKNPFWSSRAIRSFLTAVPVGRMLVLDLQSEQFPQYVRTASYAGQPFIWCMLSNFGGTLGMLGSVENVYRGIRGARNNSTFTMIGTGITPEGIHQNYAMYEFALEMGWDEGLDSTERWFNSYATSRYGTTADGRAQEAWNIFRTTVYSFAGLELMRGKYTFNRRPSSKLSPWVWYDINAFNQGVQLLLSFAEDTNCNELCKHDLVDVTRQLLQNTADALYLTLMADYKRRDVTRFRGHATLFLELLFDLDRLLLTNEHFLLGPFLESAKSFGETSLERQKYEYNARVQLTLWGPQGQIVDYANKQWAGMVRDFFRARWSIFLDELDRALISNGTINETKIREKIFRTVELPFTTDNRHYNTSAVGNTVETARFAYDKWLGKLDGLKKLPTTDTGKKNKRRKTRWLS